MNIVHNEAQHLFEIYNDENQKMGKLAYHYQSEKVIDVFTTQVKPEFQGKGIAGKLYSAMIEFVQKNDLKVIPSCSYIDVKMQRSHSELIEK